MSSILKALKKLEDKSDTADPIDGAGVLRFTRTRARRASLLGWFWLRPVFVISGFILIAIGWYFVRAPHKSVIEKPVISKTAENPDSQQVPPQISPGPTRPAQGTFKPPIPASTPQASIVPQRETEPQGEKRLALPNPRPMVYPEPAPKPIPERSVKETVITEKPVARSASPPQTQPAEPRPSPPVSSPSSPAPLPPLSQGDGLKLEALFWSSTPERRVAVINSQLVKEGEHIGSVEIKHIEQEHVVIQKDGRLWQLRYRSRQ